MASREERRTKREEKSETAEDEVKKKKKKTVKKTVSQLWSNYAEVIGPSKALPTSNAIVLSSHALMCDAKRAIAIKRTYLALAQCYG